MSCELFKSVIFFFSFLVLKHISKDIVEIYADKCTTAPQKKKVQPGKEAVTG